MSALQAEKIISFFKADAQNLHVVPHGSGHIHDTYSVTLGHEGAQEEYILQRINQQVFRDVSVLMGNLVCVSHHLRSRLEARGEKDINRHVLTVIPTLEGASYYLDDQADAWRLFIRVMQAYTVDVPDSVTQVQEAGYAYGSFLRCCADLPPTRLRETIPHFHNGLRRYADFRSALARDCCDRARYVRPEIDAIRKQTEIFSQVNALAAMGKLPLRITHNDTKINNVMLDEHTGSARCVIDLDTVMPGLALYDFGDLVRTTASPIAEDAPEVSSMEVQVDRIKAALDGYLAGAGECLLASERETLMLGARFMPLLMATRFLADFLTGDVYFKTARMTHNLDRCRTQLRLLEDLSALIDDIRV